MYVLNCTFAPGKPYMFCFWQQWKLCWTFRQWCLRRWLVVASFRQQPCNAGDCCRLQWSYTWFCCYDHSGYCHYYVIIVVEEKVDPYVFAKFTACNGSLRLRLCLLHRQCWTVSLFFRAWTCTAFSWESNMLFACYLLSVPCDIFVLIRCEQKVLRCLKNTYRNDMWSLLSSTDHIISANLYNNNFYRLSY